MHPASFTVAPLKIAPDDNNGWQMAVDHVRAALGAPHNPSLLPPHFLKSAFRRLGGRILMVSGPEKASETPMDEVSGVVFAMPRLSNSEGFCVYTLRLHWSPGRVGQRDPSAIKEIVDQCAALLAPSPVVLYDPRTPGPFMATHHLENGLDLGRPDEDEVAQMRRLQQQLWAVPDDFLYPPDIHTPKFGAATSLVARDVGTGHVAGTLLGFFKWDESPLPPAWAGRFQSRLRIESQSLAVDPTYRRRGIGFALKRLQVRQAQAEGVDLIEWTTDPLLFANAVLNFGKLRAVCTQFYPDLIPFRNALNRVAASRLRITLLAPSRRVQDALAHPDATPSVLSLANTHLPVRVNDGWSTPLFGVAAPSIAIEVPADWTALQRTDLDTASHWRAITDRLLSHYVGDQPGKYILTTPARDGDRCFLIGERVEGDLLAQLGAV